MKKTEKEICLNTGNLFCEDDFKEKYLTPKTKIISLETEGIICGSIGSSDDNSLWYDDNMGSHNYDGSLWDNKF